MKFILETECSPASLQENNIYKMNIVTIRKLFIDVNDVIYATMNLECVARVSAFYYLVRLEKTNGCLYRCILIISAFLFFQASVQKWGCANLSLILHTIVTSNISIFSRHNSSLDGIPSGRARI